MKKNIWILGVSGVGNRFHDNSACLVKNGQVVFAASEERYTRIKHDPSFPKKAIKAALDYAGIKRPEIDAYATSWPPISPLKTFLKVDKKGPFLSAINFLKNSPVESFPAFLKFVRRVSFKPESEYLPARKLIIVDHYLAHAVSAYRTSGFNRCLAIIWDGFGSIIDGSLASGGVFICRGGEIKQVETHPLEVSIGLFYEAVTNALGFVPAEGEGKTMGLAAYGNPKRFLKKMRPLAPLFKKGKWVKSQYWPDALTSIDLEYKKLFDLTFMGKELAKMIRKSPEDTAAACQYIIEQEAVKYFRYLYQRYKMTNYVTAGGVFLNVKMGKKLRELPFVNKFFVHPHAGDGGGALGAALEVYTRITSDKSTIFEMRTAAWGDDFSSQKIKKILKKTKGVVYKRPKNLAYYVARRLVEGVVIGWFQGKAEWGPRALGQRSVFADPRKIEIKDRINYILKERKWFMPFAPSIKEEKAAEWFVDGERSPFMTMAYDVIKGKAKKIQGAIHIDNTARPNTVNKKEQLLYWQVLDEFEKLTGVPVILNTSFNKHGLPIVNSPQDALNHLLWGCIDELIIGPFVVKKDK
jgi:carbamoyltransferase